MLLHFTWSMLTVSLRSGEGGWEVSLREIYIWLKVCFFPVFLKVAVTAHKSEEQVKMTAEMDSSLVSQCLAFCQTLPSQGKAFNFKLTNTSFRWRSKFLKKKLNFVSLLPSVVDTPAGGPPASNTCGGYNSNIFLDDQNYHLQMNIPTHIILHSRLSC